MLHRCCGNSSSERGAPCAARYAGDAQTMSCTVNSRRAMRPSSGGRPMRNPRSARSCTQLPMRSSRCTSACTSACWRQNSSMTGQITGRKVDRGATMRSGPATSSFDARTRCIARSSAASAGCVASRNCWPSSVSAMLRVVRCNSRAPRCCSSCDSAWLAACGLTPCAVAARRRLPSSTALANISMARSSLIAMWGLLHIAIINFSLRLVQGSAV